MSDPAWEKAVGPIGLRVDGVYYPLPEPLIDAILRDHEFVQTYEEFPEELITARNLIQSEGERADAAEAEAAALRKALQKVIHAWDHVSDEIAEFGTPVSSEWWGEMDAAAVNAEALLIKQSGQAEAPATAGEG